MLAHLQANDLSIRPAISPCIELDCPTKSQLVDVSVLRHKFDRILQYRFYNLFIYICLSLPLQLFKNLKRVNTDSANNMDSTLKATTLQLMWTTTYVNAHF